jgi:hypothetical protein
MGLDLHYIDGQTPLDEEEKDGLLIPTIATRGELDEFEQQNIEQAVQWTLVRSFKPNLIFTEDFIRTVHKRMYGNGRVSSGKPIRILGLTNGKYHPTLNTCWMMLPIGTKTIFTRPMKLLSGSSTAL